MAKFVPQIFLELEQTNDIFLLERLKQNDHKAFNLIYDMYWEKLFAFCFKLTGSKDFSSEIIQIIFVQLWEKRNEIEISNLKSYLFQSVKYQFFSIYKKNKVQSITLLSDIEDYLIDNMNEEHPEILNSLKRALEKLPDKRKEILLLSKYQNMSVDEISLLLEISPQTVRNQVSKALIQLRDIMSKGFVVFIYIKLTF